MCLNEITVPALCVRLHARLKIEGDIRSYRGASTAALVGPILEITILSE
jgi:hypothetical protein